MELQNGCLAQAHSNLFIPSTLKGSCANDERGAVNQDRLKENLDLATNVYINRCDGCSCGDTVIHLFRGVDSSKLQELRALLQIFLKGSQQKKKQLHDDYPEAYFFLNTVWSVRNQHIVSDLPEMYIFLSVLLFSARMCAPTLSAEANRPQHIHSSHMVH